MGKYDKYSSQSRMAERPWEIHPVWRGIGCLMMVLIPIISYAGAVLLVEANIEQRWVPVSFDLMRKINLPLIGSVDHLFANLLVTVVLSIIGFALLTAAYALLYRFIGPPIAGPLDAPPQRRRPRRKR